LVMVTFSMVQPAVRGPLQMAAASAARIPRSQVFRPQRPKVCKSLSSRLPAQSRSQSPVFRQTPNYVITFKAIQRTNCCNTTGQDVGVYIDSTLLGTFHLGNTAYEVVRLANLKTKMGTMKIRRCMTLTKGSIGTVIRLRS